MSHIDAMPRVRIDLKGQEAQRQDADAINRLIHETALLDDRVTTLETVIVELVPSGYGAVIEEADVPGFALGGGWVTLPFDTQTTLTTRGISFDLVNNTFTATQIGAWRFSTGFALQGHNSSNGGRLTNLRLFNITQGSGGQPYPIGIGRNVEDTSANVSGIIEVASTDTFRIEIGGGDSVTGGTLVSSSVAFNFVDRLGLVI